MAAIRQDLNVGLLAFIGTVGAMIVLIAVVGVQAWFAYESDLILAERYSVDQNLDWILLREEQYGNIGDTVGNATIYAAAGALTGEGRQATPTATASATAGYRWISDDRQRLVIPIHAAMAEVVRQHGGDITTEEMARLDEALYIRLTSNHLADPQSHVQRETMRADATTTPTTPTTPTTQQDTDAAQ